MSEHQLIKTNKEWYCQVCCWTWRGKPRAECPGVRRYEQPPEHLCSLLDLKKQNLKPNQSPIGCVADEKTWLWLYDPNHTEIFHPYPIFNCWSKINELNLKTTSELQALNLSTKEVTPQGMSWGGKWNFLYKLEDCPLADASLPPIYSWNNRPPHLETPHNLQKYNLKPGNAPTKGCVWDERRAQWTFLYDPKDEGFEILDPSLPPCYLKEAVPPELKSKGELKLLNLKPKEDAQSRGCYRSWEKYSKYEWDLITVRLYHIKDCLIADPNAPTCYLEDNYPTELKTEKELESLSLVPGDQPARGCYRRFWYGEVQTILLYHPDDCQWQPKDNFICKTTLRQTYLLSQSWIKRLGEPDQITENPHHEKWASMQLFSRQRVEAFLAENATEYAQWLTDRDRYLAIFEQNREAIEQGRTRALQARRGARQAKKEQMARCLRCASGCATERGFLCAIHPLGLEPHLIPCPDWILR